MVKLEFKHVVSAVSSLYDDQLKPFGRILLKRVGERASGDDGDGGIPAPFVDARRLRSVCESCPRLIVEGQPGGEYVVLLRGRAPNFMDPADVRDPYSEALWEELAFYFSEMGEGSSLPLPGGRYACARALLTRDLPCLRGRSLGEVCHIVALAVTKRRILGYSDGGTVPFSRSEAKMKEMCAAHQLPICNAKGASTSLTVADWEATRACLWELLTNAEERGGTGLIPVPNVKRLFRSRFQLELSETALGHSRLQDLLNDVQLRDVCEVRQCGNVNVVAKAATPPAICRGTVPRGYFVGQPGAPPVQAAPTAAELPWQGGSGMSLLSTPGLPSAAPAGAPQLLPQPGAAGPCGQAVLYGHEGVYGLDESVYWGQSQAAHYHDHGDIWRPVDQWHQHHGYDQAIDALELPWPSEAFSERGAPECLSSGTFFDFLGQEGSRRPSAAPSEEAPPFMLPEDPGKFLEGGLSCTSKRSTQCTNLSDLFSEEDPNSPTNKGALSGMSKCSTQSATLSDIFSSSSDTEAAENERGNPASSQQDSEASSESCAGDAPRKAVTFWEVIAREEFGKPAVVTKNTFIHITPDSLAQRASSWASARCRHSSVPCSARLSA